MSGDVAAEVAAVLAEHLWNGCTDPACDPGSDPEVCVRRPFLNHLAEAVAPLIAERVAAAQADALREAAAMFEGDSLPYSAADVIWVLNDRADQIGDPR